VVKKAKRRKEKRKETPRFEKSRCATPTKDVMWGGVLDIVNHAKFQLRRGQSLPFPMLSNMAYITRYDYCPTCDYKAVPSPFVPSSPTTTGDLGVSSLKKIWKCGNANVRG